MVSDQDYYYQQNIVIDSHKVVERIKRYPPSQQGNEKNTDQPNGCQGYNKHPHI